MLATPSTQIKQVLAGVKEDDHFYDTVDQDGEVKDPGWAIFLPKEAGEGDSDESEEDEDSEFEAESSEEEESESDFSEDEETEESESDYDEVRACICAFICVFFWFPGLPCCACVGWLVDGPRNAAPHPSDAQS